MNDTMSRMSPTATTMIKMSPTATRMIRMDHTHVLATFHKYRLDASPDKKHAIAETICLALEIHARIEEEIFYPAMRSVDPDLVDKSIPEHNDMRRLIAQLRQTRPQDQAFDQTLMELMREVMRHVADEETMLLPDAERVLGDQRLSELGAEMTRRRFQLAAPRAGEIAVNTVRSFPAATLAVTGMFVVGAFLVGRAVTRPNGTSKDAGLRALRRGMNVDKLRAKSESLARRLRRATAA
jgi:hemerythrin superfamily protein